ncbi:hypothetical protein [Parabacteroides pacaensis]|uniref:hypothetical protein n=1 Tax=Parabacteroides pacaensis TaxID=2086575 RepID=UPI000D0F8FBA|nr:hypothetical protein [Parabacteroides pacaensis]
MKKSIFSLSLLVLMTFIACNNTSKKAQARLVHAKELYEKNDLYTAKQEIDSIRILYPKEYKAIKEGLTLIRQIEVKEQKRNLAYCDSLLPIRQAQAEEMKKDFLLEKDTAYNEIGNYVFKSQTIERNVQRCYIRCGVDEKGEMYLASVYYGKNPLKHTYIKVSTPDGLFAETQAIPYDGGNNYRFEDLGMTTEVVTYKSDKAKDAIKFIYSYPKERIKVEYMGGKPFIIYLADLDKKAIQVTYDFACVLSDIENIQKNVEKSKKKLDYLTKKLNSGIEN